MRKARRIAIIAAASLAGVLLVGWLAARLYLHSGHATNQIAGKLQDVLGVPVRIDGVDVGIRGDSTLSRLQLFEGDGLCPVITG